jgi:asparaginyl-tRNA synthetase
MIEPELAFADINDNMQCAEDYIKFCMAYILENNMDEIVFFDKFVEKGLLERLQNVVATPFKRLSYTEAIEVLLD